MCETNDIPSRYHDCDPIHVVKYLARYLSGGPISDRRLIPHADGKVTCWARTKDKRNKSEPFTRRGPEFIRRWSMHVLPQGYTRSRSYGGFHGAKPADYLKRCRQLLNLQLATDDPTAEPQEVPEPSLPKCDHCKIEMACTSSTSRPSWQEIFTQSVSREPVYYPLLHIQSRAIPEAHTIGGYG